MSREKESKNWFEVHEGLVDFIRPEIFANVVPGESKLFLKMAEIYRNLCINIFLI